MANLIITIISIALVAVAAIMGAYYVGDMFTNNVDKVRASTLLEQSRQIQAAGLKYMAENGVNSFNDFRPDDLVIKKYLSGRPPMFSVETIGTGGPSGFTPLLNSTNISDTTCSSDATGHKPAMLDGHKFVAFRTNGRAFQHDSVIYNIFAIQANAAACLGGPGVTVAEDLSIAAMSNHPLVKMCRRINAQTTLPAGLNYTASGLPYFTGSNLYGAPFNADYINNPITPNICYLMEQTGWGPGYAEMIFIFTH